MLSRISASSVRPLGAHPVREFLAFQDEGAAIRSSIRSTGPNTNVVMRAREAPKLAQAKRAIEDMLERVQRAQSSIGEPRPLTAKTGGESLGSANQINDLYRNRPVGSSFLLQFFSKSIAGHAGPACCAFSCLRFPMRSKPLHSEGRGREFESRRARQ
jgi:hypothetical protein